MSGLFPSSSKELKGKCVGEVVARARSHVMWVSGPLTFCIHCGGHIGVSLRKLAPECPRRATTVAMSRALDRLRQGLHPTKEDIVGAPRPFYFSSSLIVSSSLALDSESDLEVS